MPVTEDEDAPLLYFLLVLPLQVSLASGDGAVAAAESAVVPIQQRHQKNRQTRKLGDSTLKESERQRTNS